MALNLHSTDRVVNIFSARFLYWISVWDYQRNFLCFADMSWWFFPPSTKLFTHRTCYSRDVLMNKDGLEVLKAVFPISICSHVASCGRASSILTIEKSIATLDFREAPFHAQSKACPMMIDRKSHLFLLGKFFTLKCDVLSVTQTKNKNIE